MNETKLRGIIRKIILSEIKGEVNVEDNIVEINSLQEFLRIAKEEEMNKEEKL